ncbi:MAG: tetratricopeptide repeat protein [Gemmataceae bacterium]
MSNALMFLRCVGKGMANAVGGGVAGDILFEALPEVAAVAWKWWAGNRSPQQRQADLAAVAAAPPEQIKLEAKELVLEFAGDRTPEQQKALEAYLTLVPGQVRRSMRSPSDPTGTTVALDQVPRNENDLIALLPTKLPRFKPGERPLPGVDWELEELLGVGGFGEVWKARNPHFSSMARVALKFCLDPSAAQYLRNEAAVLDRVMRQGRHPGIVTLERTYLSSETPCLEYEYVEGGDLAGLIQSWHRADPRPSPAEITRHLLGLTESVGVAHGQNPPIVHRDLKPANVLRYFRDGSWLLKVADFGIGGLATRQAIRQQTQATSPGLFLTAALRGSCTPLYASPQQMRGDGPDPRDDVFSLGVIWYQMLTGDLTHGRPGGSRWQKRLVEGGMSEGLVELLAECFEDAPDDRVADAGTLAARLAKLLPAVGVEPVKQAPPPKPAEPLVLTTPPAQHRIEFPPNRREEDQRRKQGELVFQLAELNAKVERTPGDAGLLTQRAELLRLLNKPDDAIADCTEAIRLRPTLAAAYATRGGAYRLRGKLEAAVADCTRAVEIDARNLLAWYNRGEAHRLRNDNDKAIADCTRALEIDPSYSWAYGTRGAARRAKGDLAGAVADLNETLRLDPGYVWAWAVRGETRRLMNDHDGAIEDCSEALRLDGSMSLAYATRGAAFRQKGDFSTAAADLQQALRLKPDYQWARDQLELARKRQK